MKYLTTATAIYLVSFNGVYQQFVFAGDLEVLGNLIQKYGEHGIVFVKRFDFAKSNFKKMSKDQVIACFAWDTHTTEQLKKINFVDKKSKK